MENKTTENKKSFFQNDRRLVCSMLMFYGLCFFGLVFGAFLWVNQRDQMVSANATSTAAVVATQRAAITSTAIARATEQNNYEYIEHFDKYSKDWFIGQYQRQYGNAHVSIRDGAYIWNVKDPKSFTQATEFHKGNRLTDFDIYMDSKVVESSKIGTVCSGFFFRKPNTDWKYGAYVFTVCNNSHFKVLYYGKDGWQTITYSDYEREIQNTDWNRIEVSARDDHFTFIINNKKVFEMTDRRLTTGSLGIFIDIEAGNSAVIWFDNFGYQSR